MNSGVQPMHNLSLLRQVKTVELVGDEPGKVSTSTDFAHAAVVKGLQAIEQLIDRNTLGTPGLFAAGTTSPSIADILLVPLFHSAKRFGVDSSVYTSVARIVSYCDQLPAFQSAIPEVQPDFVA